MKKLPYESGRWELKYLLPLARRRQVLELIAPQVRPDSHARPLADGSIGYRVHSLYFDTPRLKDYFERLDERRVRNRLRIRTYGSADDDQPVFLENKRKSGRWVVKHRARLGSSQDWRHGPDRPWLELDTPPADGGFATHSFNTLVNGARRVPVTIVHYLREVFVPCGLDHQRVRLTLDRQIRADFPEDPHDLFGDGAVELIPSDWMVLELKFDTTAPAWMRQLSRSLELRAVPVSKFGLSVATTHRRDRPRELRLLTPPPLRRTA
jgi:hypothetical protein